MPNDLPINKAEIRTLIPHSGLMCLLDQVTQWDDRSIKCVANTHRDPANPLRRSGHLAALHAFEYGAQAAQSTAGCTHAPLAQLRQPATWLHCATRACMWRTWMTSDRRCRFPPT